MNEAQMMHEAVMKRVDQLIVSPDQPLQPSEWKLTLGISPDNLRRLVKFDADYHDAIFIMGEHDQRTTRARFWRCQDRAAKRARESLKAKSLGNSVSNRAKTPR
jgi:hypothetical protein